MTATQQAHPPAHPPENIALVTDGFETFFREQHQRLFSALCLITRNRHEAEELTQEAFLAVWERWDRAGSWENPEGYLYRTAMNAFRKRYRKSRRLLHPVASVQSTDGGIGAVDANDVAMRALEPLSPTERAAVVLTDLLGFPSEEAATFLHTTPGAVRTAASRGRAELRRLQGGTPS